VQFKVFTCSYIVSSEEIYQKLKNDKEFIKNLVNELSRSPEFINEVAEALKPELINIVTDKFKKFGDELRKVNENLKTLIDKVGKIENNQGETNKRLESIEDLQKKTLNKLADIKGILTTDIKGTLNAMNRQEAG